MTPQVLALCTGAAIERATQWAPYITMAMDEYSINTDARQAAFLAQIGHESGGLIWVRELWGPTRAQQKYEGRVDLGNTHFGDGYRFRGRGLIQVTGRANYARMGAALGIDLEEHPDLLDEPVLAARSAACYWQSHGLNEFADADDFETITRKINGGINGLVQRQHLWAAAKEALNVA